MSLMEAGARREGIGNGVAWLAAYAIGLAASGHDDPTSERLLLDAAGRDRRLLDRTRARVESLTCHDEGVRRRAARLLRRAAPDDDAEVLRID